MLIPKLGERIALGEENPPLTNSDTERDILGSAKLDDLVLSLLLEDGTQSTIKLGSFKAFQRTLPRGYHGIQFGDKTLNKISLYQEIGRLS